MSRHHGTRIVSNGLVLHLDPANVAKHRAPVDDLDFLDLRTIPNLQGWWDASDASTVTLDENGGVTRLADKSGFDRHLVESGDPSNRPSYIIGGLNGRNVLSFQHTLMQRLTYDGPSPRFGTTDLYAGDTDSFHVFAVSICAVSGTRVVVGRGGGIGGSATFNLGFSNFSVMHFMRGSAFVLPITPPSWTIMSSRWDGAAARGFTDGDEGLAVTPGESTSRQQSSPFNIGAGGTGATANLSGQIAEVLVFDRALDVDERRLVEGYLAKKWGLVPNLPTLHRFAPNSFVNLSRRTSWASLTDYPAIGGAFRSNVVGADGTSVIDFSGLSITTGSITVQFMMKVNIDPNVNANNNWRRLVSRSNGTRVPFGFVLEQTMLINFTLTTTSATKRSVDGDFRPSGASVGQWHLHTYTYDRTTGIASVYRDTTLMRAGPQTLEGGGSPTLPGEAMVDLTPDMMFTISRNNPGATGGDAPLPCDIGPFLIYDRALTATEIAVNFAAYRGRFGI